MVFQIGSTLHATNATVCSLTARSIAIILADWFVGDDSNQQYVRRKPYGANQYHARCGVLNGRALARNGAVTLSAQETVDAVRALAMSCQQFFGWNRDEHFLSMPYVLGHLGNHIATGLTSPKD